MLDNVGYERLILSACHPLYSAAQRIIVFARQVKRQPSRVKRDRDADGALPLDGGLVAGLEEEDQADHQGQRDGQDREPVEDLEQHGGRRRDGTAAGTALERLAGLARETPALPARAGR